MKLLSIFTAIFALALPSAKAQDSQNVGIWVEPGVTYEISNATLDWPAPFNDSTGNLNGLGLNFKGGIHAADIFFGGLDISWARPKLKDSGNDYDAQATSTLLGAVAGVQMPVYGLRVWGGYIFGGELDPDKSADVDLKFKNPRGYKLGAGIKLMMVSLNLEYRDVVYNATDVQEVGPITGPDTDYKMTNKSWVLGVSFPLTL